MADNVPLTQGTVEYLLFDWADILGALASLAGTTPVFDVKDELTSFSYYTSQTASFVGLTQYCLVDTTTSPAGSPSGGGIWIPGNYRIWVKLTTGLGLEKPREGHYTFVLSA